MRIPVPWPQCFDFFGAPIVIEPSPGQLSGDAGLLPIRQFDQRVGLTRAFADALDDPRDPDLTEHSFLEMVRSRVYGILAGYEDQNDHDTLRTDPVFMLGRQPGQVRDAERLPRTPGPVLGGAVPHPQPQWARPRRRRRPAQFRATRPGSSRAGRCAGADPPR